MAKTNEEFDRIFREKLENHEDKPSTLAWEKLESRLPGKKTRGVGIWWAVAAGMSIFLVSGWLIWNNLNEPEQKKQLAEEQPVTKKPEELPSSPEPIQEWVAESKPEQDQLIKKSEGQSLSTRLVANSPIQPVNEELITLAKEAEENTAPLIAREEPLIPELPTTTVLTDPKPERQPLLAGEPLISQKSIAEAKPSEEETSIYRVKIYSDGLKKGSEPEKNLITEMGKTVGKVEGLLGKVDEGFAELQVRKNSLFAGLTTKK